MAGLREYIFDLITDDTIMNAFGVVSDSTFTDHYLDTPQVRPLCILRWQNVIPGQYGGEDGFPVNHRLLTVWVHDDKGRGDYDRIDGSLNRLRTLLMGIRGVNIGVPGAWITRINWEGNSDDLRDDDLRTIMRFSTFRITGSAI